MQTKNKRQNPSIFNLFCQLGMRDALKHLNGDNIQNTTLGSRTTIDHINVSHNLLQHILRADSYPDTRHSSQIIQKHSLS